MTRDDAQFQPEMNDAFDQERSDQELEALHAHLEEAPESNAYQRRLQQVNQLLRSTPMVAPLPEFADRVMAAIEALPLPEFAQRQLGIGIMLGLVVVALLTVPVLSMLLIVLLRVLTDPGTLHTLLRVVIDAAGYIISLAADIAGEIRTATTDTPMVPALLTTTLLITVFWISLFGYLLGGLRTLKKRLKS